MKKKIVIKISIAALASIVLLEFIFIKAELFQYVPNIGIFFHLFAGFFVGIATYYFFDQSLLKLEWYLIAAFITGAVGITAIGWETFEWVLGMVTGSPYQASVDDTMKDLLLSLSGGLAACSGVCFRNVFSAKVH